MSDINRQVTLASRPVGFPKESDFKLVESAKPTAGDGQVLIATKWLTVDPYMRGRMNEQRGYAEPFGIGKVITGGATGQVVESKNPAFPVDSWVTGMWGWQDSYVSDGSDLTPVDPNIAPVQTSLGVLGMPGMTAYFGLLELTHPKDGDNVFVSGAAGAVGELVGQIAKIKGCKVYGSAGTDEKVTHLLDNCGYDGAFNYKTEKDWLRTVRKTCPDGIDVYFDNVGGDMTDAVMMNLNQFARISICGAISAYNITTPDVGPRLFTLLLIKQATATGFLVPQFGAKWPEGVQQMAEWIQAGKITYREDVMEGLENTPKAFIGMLNGQNKGKQLVKV